MSKANAREWLVNVIDDLFNRDLTEDEFMQHDMVLGEMESHAVEDGWLTWEDIMEIHETWKPNMA